MSPIKAQFHNEYRPGEFVNMPFCPVCLSEFREGFDRCNSCDEQLVTTLPEEMDLSEINIKEKLDGKHWFG